MLEADAATTVARFHELVTMQVCGDEPDDEMRYRCENSTLQTKALPQAALRWWSAYCSAMCVREHARACVRFESLQTQRLLESALSHVSGRRHREASAIHMFEGRPCLQIQGGQCASVCLSGPQAPQPNKTCTCVRIA